MSKAEMPLDTHNNPVPVLHSKTPHNVPVTAGEAIAEPISLARNFIYIETDNTVYFKFGDAAVVASANDFKASLARTIPVPEDATHISLFGADANANVYIEEQG